ncbi:hypothetical protein B9W61_14760 [Streptomyces sp. CS057]|nr:hypothetical protein B9W61_14760 [Streptomyces sp. CS057]
MRPPPGGRTGRRDSGGSGGAFGAGAPMGTMCRSAHEAPDVAAVPEGLRPTGSPRSVLLRFR